MRYLLLIVTILIVIIGCSPTTNVTTIGINKNENNYVIPYNFGQYVVINNHCKIHIELYRNPQLFRTDTSERIDIFIDYDLIRKCAKSAFFVRTAFRVSFGKGIIEHIDVQQKNNKLNAINIIFASSTIDSSSIKNICIKIKGGTLFETSKTKFAERVNSYDKEIIEKYIDNKWFKFAGI